jgi:hypothetical protein
MDSPEARQLDSTRLLRMTDSQIAAITWHLQLEKFFDVFKNHDSSQVRSLHCDRLLEDPKESIASLIDFFDFTSLSENFDKLMDQAPLQSNAKTPDQKFDAGNRSQEYAKARHEFSDTLEVIIPWAKQLSFKYNYADNIANPL